MKAWRLGAGVGVLVSALVIGSASCGDDDDDGGGGGGGTQVDPDPLNLEIISLTVPEGVGARPVVRFRVTDQAGAAIDVAAEIAAANASPQTYPNMLPRFTLAQLDDDGNYKSAYSNPAVAPKAYTPPEGQTAPPTSTVEQATSQPPSRNAAGVTQPWPVADLVAAGGGNYDYTLPPTTVATDRTKTHTVASWIDRKRTSSDSDIAYDAFNVVPAGGTALIDEVVSDAACTHCHGVVQAHGSRRGVPLCITCHSPQTSDPETSRPVDFQVMIHKIHFGRDLPSVQQGRNYFIVGNSQNVHDYSEVAFPWHDGVQHCTVCHQGEDADNWRQKPSITACTSCHDNVKFDGSAGSTSCSSVTPPYADCNHSAGPQDVAPDSTTTCFTCHGPAGPAPVDSFHHGG